MAKGQVSVNMGGGTTTASGYAGGGNAVAAPRDQKVEPFDFDDEPAPQSEAEESQEIEEVDAPTDEETPETESVEDSSEEDGEQEEKVAESEPQLDASLLSYARDLGYTDEDAKELGDKALRRLLAKEERVHARRLLTQNQQKTQQQQTPAPQAQQPAPQTTSKLDLKLDNVEPEIADAIKAMQSFYEDRISKLESQSPNVSRADQMVRELVFQRKVEQFDGALSRLPAEFKPLLGEGSVSDMTPGSEQFKARDEIGRAHV